MRFLSVLLISLLIKSGCQTQLPVRVHNIASVQYCMYNTP